MDGHTYECLALHAGSSIRSKDVLDILSELIGNHGPPRHIRSDNGPEFIAGSIREWLGGPRHRNALRRAKDSLAERLHRIVQQLLPGRVPGDELFQQPEGGPVAEKWKLILSGY